MIDIWILIITSILIFTEISYFSIVKTFNRHLDFLSASFVKIVSIIIGVLSTGVLYFGWQAISEMDLTLLFKQLTEIAFAVGSIVAILGVLFGWIMINKYIGNKYIVKK